MLKVIIPKAQCGTAGFESPAAEYKQVGLNPSELLIQYPETDDAYDIEGGSMIGDGIFG
jgi:DNA polymerase V